MKTAHGIAIAGLSLLALVGCARPLGPRGIPGEAPVPATYASNELAGTWRGSFSQISAALYTDEANCTLQIRDDGTFTETVTPVKGAANNLAKAWTSSGSVVQRGQRVTLRSTRGTSLTLIRAGDALYGVAEDPLVEATIALSFKREGPTS